MPFDCLNSSDSLGISGSCERHSIGGSLEFGIPSSSLMDDDDDDDVGG